LPLFPGLCIEVHKFEDVCRARASARQTPQKPAKTLIFEKLADPPIFQNLLLFQCFVAASAL